MRGGTSGDLNPGAFPGGLQGPPSFRSPAAIFPLPGGREVAASAWIADARDPPEAQRDPDDPISTAERRRWFARRRGARSSELAVRPLTVDVPLVPARGPPAHRGSSTADRSTEAASSETSAPDGAD